MDLLEQIAQLLRQRQEDNPALQEYMRRPSRLGPTPQELRQLPTRPVMPPPRRIEPQRYRDPEIGETPPPFPFVRIPADAPVHPPGRDSPDAFPATDAGGFDWARSAFPRAPNRFPPSLLAQREPVDREPWRQVQNAPQIGTMPQIAPGDPAPNRGLEPPSAAPVDYAAAENADWNAAVERARQMLLDERRREVRRMPRPGYPLIAQAWSDPPPRRSDR